jgi:nucleoside-diphosphate-sugar epimerase
MRSVISSVHTTILQTTHVELIRSTGNDQDARDGAQAVRKGLETQITGHQVYIISNPDTCFRTKTDVLAKEQFPEVTFDPKVVKESDPEGEFGGFETLLSCAKARRELGFSPRYSWRNGGETPWRG